MSKNVVVEKKGGECVKGGKKGRKSIIKSKRIFKKKGEIHSKRTTKIKETWEKQMFKKEIKKENVQKTQENTHKKGKIEKKDREKDEHAKTYKCVKMSNKKVKKLLKMQKCQIRVSKRQRQQEEKKRQQMNKSMNKKKGGHKEATPACKQK